MKTVIHNSILTILITTCAKVCHLSQKPTFAGKGGYTHDGSGDIMIKMLTITETRCHTAVPYLGFVSKKRRINVHNNTRSTQHEWCIMIQEPPAANVPEKLVCLDCCILLSFGFLHEQHQ